MPEFPDIHLQILHNALAVPLGLVVATTTPSATKMALERARATDAALSHLRIIISRSNPGSEIWIENTKVELA